MDMTREYWNGEAGEIWASHADVLDQMLEPLGEAAMDVLAPRPGERVLDIGCGAGATSRALARRVGSTGSVLGVDVSGPLIDQAQANAREAGGPAFLLGDAGADPLPAPPFDAAFSRFGVMFFPDPRAAFAHVRAAMRPGGRLAFVCWRAIVENAWAMQPLQAVAPLLREIPPPPPPDAPGPFSFADRARVSGILDGAGFRDVEIRPFDPGYLLGTTVEQALAVMMRIGPLGRILREQALDPAPIRRALAELLGRHVTDRGVVMPAACWIATASA